MTKNYYEFSDPDILDLTQREFEVSHITDLAEKWLKDMHITGARVNFIYGPNGVHAGANRVPLRVNTGSTSFILKSFDIWDPKSEKEVLEGLSGILAPRVLFFGRGFYAEEYVDPSIFTSLESVADRSEDDFTFAINRGAQIYARLALLGIDYSHSHWLDEFHIGPKDIVTDFGTSFRFARTTKDLGFYYNYITLGKNEYFDGYCCIPGFRTDSPGFDTTKDLLWGLTGDKILLTNLMSVFAKAIEGIKYYVSRLPARYEAGIAHHTLPVVDGFAWEKTMEIFPKFVESFSERYHRG